MLRTLTDLAAEELRAARKLLQDDEGLAIVLRSIKLKEEIQYKENKVWGARRESLKNEDEAQTHADAEAASSSLLPYGKKIMLSFKDFCEGLGVYQRLPDRLVLAQNVFCANAALAKYNKEHNTDNYELVELLVSARYVAHVAGFHCNFRAVKSCKKLDDSSCGGGVNVGNSPKLFFADIVVADGKPRKIYCCIVKRRTAAKARYNCCENCPPSLTHCSCDRDLYRASHSLQVEAARKALYLYNKGRRPSFQYELVEPVSCNSTYNGVTYNGFESRRFHCNFTAKLKRPRSSHNAAASPRLFFAEFLHSTGCITDVRCYTLDTIKDLVDHCWFCRDGVVHPANYRFPSAGPSCLNAGD